MNADEPRKPPGDAGPEEPTTREHSLPPPGDAETPHLSAVAGLRFVEPPEPPENRPPTDDLYAKRHRAVTRSIEVGNDNSAAIGKAKVKGMGTTRHERYFLMGLSAFGALASVAMTALGISNENPHFYYGALAGSAITGVSLLRSSILGPDTQRVGAAK